jgi:hypothetical protein
MLSALWVPASGHEALNFPGVYFCEIATAGSPGKQAKASASAWITVMLAAFPFHRFPLEQWPKLAQLHLKLAELGGRVGISHQCPAELLAYAL